MSRWSHIVGAIKVDTNYEDAEIENWVMSKLQLAPKITGSEQDCSIFVNPVQDYNTYIGKDCDHCYYGDFKCEEVAPDDFQCPEGRYQTCVVITLQGDLRDRSGEETQAAADKFIHFLMDMGWWIDDIAIAIDDECEDIVRFIREVE